MHLSKTGKTHYNYDKSQTLICALLDIFKEKNNDQGMTSKHQINTTSSTSSQFKNGFYCRIIPKSTDMCEKKIPDSFAFVNFPIEKVLKKIHSWKAVANKQNAQIGAIVYILIIFMNPTNVLRKYLCIYFRKKGRNSWYRDADLVENKNNNGFFVPRLMGLAHNVYGMKS